MDKEKEKARQARMREELDGLNGNCERLHNFIQGGIFESLPVEEQGDLKAQHNGMLQYQSALKNRVDRLEPVED